MLNTLKKGVYAFFLFILALILCFAPEFIPDEFKQQVQSWTWENSHTPFLWIFFGFFIIVWLLNNYLESRKESSQMSSSTSNDGFDNRRNYIIESIKERYQKRYNQKLDERIELDLELTYTQKGTSKSFTDRFFAKEAKTQTILQQKLAEAVLEFHYLLIIGQPGAGKTTLLLETAITLLDKAQIEDMPIPVIFNLSLWQKGSANFSAWMVDMLVEGNGFSRKLAQEAVENNRIAPFLDGLDELGRSLSNPKERDILRGECLAAISEFRRTKEPKFMVICSRIEEYETVKNNAPVSAEILVNPLSIEQIETILSDENTIINSSRPSTNPVAAKNILHLIKTTPSIKPSLCVPFYFHLATQVFGNQLIDIKIPDTRKEFESYLVETFVVEKLRSSTSAISRYKKRRSLSWLASKLNDEEMVWFEITFLEPFRLERPKYYIAYINHLLMILFLLTATLTLTSKLGLVGLGLGLSVTAIFRSSNFSTTKISLFEKKIHKWKRVLSKPVILATICFSTAYIAPLIYHNLGLPLSFLIGISFASLFSWLVFSETIIPFVDLNKPYQRLLGGIFYQPFKVAFIVLALNLPGTLVMNAWGFNLIYKLSLVFSWGLLCGLVLHPIIRHMIVRFLFFTESAVPLRFVHFLNHATDDLHFLERDGGSWRFRHQILQDYFANLAEKSTSE